MENVENEKLKKDLNKIREEFYVAMPLDGDNSLMADFMATELRFFNKLSQKQQEEYRKLVTKRTLLNIHNEESLINFLLEDIISKNIST